MTFDNTHVSKAAAFILISLGLFQVFYAETLEESKSPTRSPTDSSTKSPTASPNLKDKINILGWITVAIGAVYMLFVLAAGMKMMQ
jgi:hypothetical protein